MKYEVKRINLNENEFIFIKNLFKAGKWDWLTDFQMKEAFLSSYSLYGGYLNNQLVSFGRVISDGEVYALIVDIMVNPSLQRKGFGNGLIQYMTEDLKENGIKVIQLLSSEKAKSIYLKNNFKACSDSAPGMILFPQNTN